MEKLKNIILVMDLTLDLNILMGEFTLIVIIINIQNEYLMEKKNKRNGKKNC